jgi:large subunit ribosomal protein L4e
MTKAKLFDKNGKESSLNLPENFSFPQRKDIILKVFEAQKEKQPHGTMFMAGAWYSASGILRRKRHAWKVTYGKGISRVPRKIMSRHGSSFNWIGATASGTRGGRRAHPPKVEENQYKKINQKEVIFALNSALSSLNNIVVFDSSVLSLKTKEFITLLKKVYGENFDKILQEKKKRAGSGKSRGRKYKKTAGLLLVISSKENMNQSGIEIVKSKELKIKNLAPAGIVDRKVAFTEQALEEIKELK